MKLVSLCTGMEQRLLHLVPLDSGMEQRLMQLLALMDETANAWKPFDDGFQRGQHRHTFSLVESVRNG